MAEGWAKTLLSNEYAVYSAGIEAHGLNPNAVLVMQESGIDISQQQSQLISDLPEISWDIIITVCDSAKERCPYIPGNHLYIHQSFDDPPSLAKNIANHLGLEIYRRVRDEIKEYIQYIPSLLLEKK
jgi:arsenate reductase